MPAWVPDGEWNTQGHSERVTRDRTSNEKGAAISGVLEEIKTLRWVKSVGSVAKKIILSSVKENDVSLQSGIQEIADAFGAFYQGLYTSVHGQTPPGAHSSQSPLIDAFTEDEIRTRIKRLRKGRAKKQSGILTEMLKYGGNSFIEAVVQLFNDVIQPEGKPANNWTTVAITLLDGDPQALPKL